MSAKAGDTGVLKKSGSGSVEFFLALTAARTLPVVREILESHAVVLGGVAYALLSWKQLPYSTAEGK